MSSQPQQASRLSHADRAGFLIIGQGMGLVVGVFSPIVITRLVNQHDYGTFRQLLLLSALVVPNATLGLPNAVLYFYPRYQGSAQKWLILQSTLLLAGMGLLSGFALAGLVGPLAVGFHNPSLAGVMPVLALYVGALVAMAHVYQILVVQEKVRRAALYGAGMTAIPTLAAIVVGLLARSVTGLTIGLAAGAVFLLALSGWIIARRLAHREQYPSETAMGGRQVLRATLAYGLPIGLSVGVISLGRYVDQVVVSALSAPALFAIYSVGWTPVRMSSALLVAVGTALVPVWSEQAQRRSFAEAMALSRKASRRIGLLSLPGIGLLYVAAPDLVPFLFSSQYAAAVPVFRASLLVLAAQIFLPEALLSGLGRTGVLLIGSAISVVLGSGLVAAGIYLLGLPGASLGAAASAFLVRWYYAISIRRTVGREAGAMLPWQDLTRISLVAAAAGLATAALTAALSPGLPRLALMLVAYTVLCGVIMVATRTFTESDRELIRRWIKPGFLLGRPRK